MKNKILIISEHSGKCILTPYIPLETDSCTPKIFFANATPQNITIFFLKTVPLIQLTN